MKNCVKENVNTTAYWLESTIQSMMAFAQELYQHLAVQVLASKKQFTYLRVCQQVVSLAGNG